MTTRYKFLLLILLGAICLIVDALYNGYPIVYSDTSTYLASGFELETPIDRPITYGLFLRLMSLNGFSLWLAIFFQSLILSYLIFIFLKQFLGQKFALNYGVLILFFISVFTGISWTCSQIMSDIFTPVAVLSLVMFLFGEVKRSVRIFLLVLYTIAVCMHLSHIAFFSVLLFIIFIFGKWLVDKNALTVLYKRIAISFILTLTSIISMGSALAKSKDVFLMGALVEQGIAKQYLDEYCGSKYYKICVYKDSLPKTCVDFVWDTNSAFYKTGGWSTENRKECHDIIMATFAEPKYIVLHIRASLKATVKQLASFDIADGNGVFLKGTLLYTRISKYVKREANAYSRSRQNRAEFLFINTPNWVYDAFTVVSGLLLFFVLITRRKKLESNFKAGLFVLLLAIVINAWDTGTFGCIANRYGCKMMWLLPLLAVVTMIKVTQPDREIKKQSGS